MAKVIKKKQISSREELEHLDKNELIAKILQVEAHNFQLKQIIEKKNGTMDNKNYTKSSKKKFDFTKCHKRHILLKFYYLGWDYHGFAVQENTTNTIEYHLFAALTKSCLIESRQTANYHRCGRTDKGVSAFSQVISLDIRSRFEPDKQDNLSAEIAYCKILNRLLPKNIRCISWSPVRPNISARFDCKSRTYKYFFPRGGLNIESMNKAVKLTIGRHDFRNLCKMDVANGVVSFNRTIVDAGITCILKEPNDKNSGYDMCQLTIKSNAFLWHQIRCIMGILFLIGREQEKPEIMNDLLDVQNHPKKPQYNLAHYIPLNLFYCEYDDANWYVDKEEILKVVEDLQEEWTDVNVKSTMIKNMLQDLQELTDEKNTNIKYQSNCLLQGVESKVYKPLLERETCESLEDRIEHYAKKRRLEKSS
ncbi:tRNA pseudouridine(38/39) synthase [Phymastichus coffea]|uniref:tRNA pseudouridine(38/39) synthase n=1 Tax=Phymastichus coffea TaxID=108790 RepID=UPI00273AE2E3|nr:tRNA pseudouridine(38/39) synthase [Phymastichus coffea]